MHRADFVDLLAANLPAGIVHTGHRAVGFDQNADLARVRFENGVVAEADVVVGADVSTPGCSPTSSRRPNRLSRHHLLPRPGSARAPAGLADGSLANVGRSIEAFPRFPVRHGTMVNYVGFVPADEEMKESWSAPVIRTCCGASSKGWDPRIGEVLKQVDKTFRWALYDREPLPTWTKGRLTLLGDAAHPMLPHLGQGANQSIEDGMALATILAQVDRARVSGDPACVRAAASGARRGGSAWRPQAWAAVSIPPATISACATHSSSRMQNSASSFTATTWCRTRAPRRQPFSKRLLLAAALRLSGCFSRLPSTSSQQAGLSCVWVTRVNSSRISAAILLGRGVALHNAERRELHRDGRGLDRLLDRTDNAFLASSGMPAGARKLNQMSNSSSW